MTPTPKELPALDLHGAIMNLQAKPGVLADEYVSAYKMGHRDARHDAAELVAASLQGIESDAALPPSYAGGMLEAVGDQCTVHLRFTDAAEAETWFERLTDLLDAAMKDAP